MPVYSGRDAEGSYYQYGQSGKKYYYTPGDEQSRKRARKKAEEQAAAIHASGYKGK